MLRRSLLVAFLGLVAALPQQAAAAPRCTQGADAVTEAFRTALIAIKEDRTAPPRAARALAALAVSMDDALARTARARACGSAGAAARAAAGTVIEKVLWATAAAERERRPRPETAASRRGRRAAKQTLGRIAGDKLNPDVAIVVPLGPELWQPAYPDFMGPTDVFAPTWRPWNVGAIERVRPPKPPTGPALQDQARQTRDATRAITDEQRAQAIFWADGAGSVTPPGHWTEIALDVLSTGRGGGQLAHDMARVATAQADAFIACWDSKYAYWLARPVTLIERTDPTWRPLLPTPPFPAYVSGHAATSAAAATVLGRLVPQRRQELWALAEQAAQSRVVAGIHFPIDSAEGLKLGRRVARAALLRPRARR